MAHNAKLALDEPGTFVYVPGFRSGGKWTKTNDIAGTIRDKVAPFWQTLVKAQPSPYASRAGVIAYVVEGRTRIAPNTTDEQQSVGTNYRWRPVQIVDTYTRESWRFGELSVRDMVNTLLPPEETETKTQGFYTDDFLYRMQVESVEGIASVVIYKLTPHGDALPRYERLPDYREYTPTELRRLARYLEAEDTEAIEALKQSARNVWRFRLLYDYEGREDQESNFATEWAECSPAVYPLPRNPPTLPQSVGGGATSRTVTVEAEEVSEDSERIPLRIELSTCALARDRASRVFNPFNDPNGPANQNRGNFYAAPVGAWTEKPQQPSFPVSQVPSVEGYTREDILYGQYTAPVINNNKVHPFITNDLSYVASGGNIELSIRAVGQNLIGPPLPIYNPTDPVLYQWAFDGFAINHEVIIELAGGTIGWWARADYPINDFRNFTGDGIKRPESFHEYTPEPPDSGFFRWYPIRHGQGSISANSGEGFKPSRSKYATGDGSTIKHKFLQGAHAVVPFPPGSVQWQVKILVTVSARYILPTDFEHCDIRRISTGHTSVLSVECIDPLDGLGIVKGVDLTPASADLQTGGFRYPVNQNIRPFVLGNRDESTFGFDPDAGLFIPETSYGGARGEYRFNSSPWDTGLLAYKSNVEPYDPPATVEPQDSELGSVPIAGYLDKYNRTHDELVKLNPLIAYVYDNKIGVLARLLKLYYAAGTGKETTDDDAQKFATKVLRNVVQAQTFFMKVLDENLLGIPGLDNINVLSFGVYFTNDPFTPVPKSTLEGPNGEGPLYGFPLVNGFRRSALSEDGTASDEVTADPTDEELELLERFWMAIYATQALQVVGVATQGLISLLETLSLLSPGDAEYTRIEALALQESLNNVLLDVVIDTKKAFTLMEPVEGSAKVLGFWRV